MSALSQYIPFGTGFELPGPRHMARCLDVGRDMARMAETARTGLNALAPPTRELDRSLGEIKRVAAAPAYWHFDAIVKPVVAKPFPYDPAMGFSWDGDV